MLVDAIRAEGFRLSKNRTALFWSLAFVPIISVAIGAVTQFVLKGSGDRQARVFALEAAGEQLLSALATYRPAMLSAYDTPNGPCSEPLEMLSLLYNAELTPVRLPYGDAGEMLPRRRVSFGTDTLELAATGESPRSLAAMISASMPFTSNDATWLRI